VAEIRIVVTKDGPYRVEGDVPVLRAAIVETDRGEPIAWQDGPEFERPDEPSLDLCRCGNSSFKPFCDTTHERIPYDGTETADRGPISGRRQAWQGAGDLVLYDDLSLCSKAGFCRNARTGVWEMLDDAGDSAVREELIAMVGRCPSGRLAHALLPDPEPVEVHYRPSIGVEPDGPYRVRGEVAVVSEDGSTYEVRNRQALCRCGHSSNKPFCDGSHKLVGFRDPATPG